MLLLSSTEGSKLDLEKKVVNPFHTQHPVAKINPFKLSQVSSDSQIRWSVKGLVNKAKQYKKKAEELDQMILEKTGIDVIDVANNVIDSSPAAQLAIEEAKALAREAEAKAAEYEE